MRALERRCNRLSKVHLLQTVVPLLVAMSADRKTLQIPQVGEDAALPQPESVFLTSLKRLDSRWRELAPRSQFVQSWITRARGNQRGSGRAA